MSGAREVARWLWVSARTRSQVWGGGGFNKGKVEGHGWLASNGDVGHVPPWTCEKDAARLEELAEMTATPSPDRPPLFVEMCAGTAAVSLRLQGGPNASPPVSHQLAFPWQDRMCSECDE